MYLQDIPSDVSAEKLLEIIQTHSYLLEQLRGVDDELYNCLIKKSVSELRLLLMSRAFRKYKQTYEKKRDYEEMLKNPDDEEVQRKIEEQIRLENINESLNLAQESLPESFGRVEMLFVRIEINNHIINAFVDSGAQSTIMSAKCAETCNLMRMIDTRFAGEARGVGTGKILGRIHIAQMKCGQSFYPISITVLEKSDIDFLFGLDNLRRYNCVLDLGKNVLRINNGGDSFEELRFLSEFEVKSEQQAADPKDSSSSSSSSSGVAQPNTQDNQNQTTKMDVSSPPNDSSLNNSSVTNQNNLIVTSNESKIAELKSLGFTEQQATIALAQAGGDVGLAASLLMEEM